MTTVEALSRARDYMLKYPQGIRKSYWYVVLFDGEKPVGYAHSAWNKQSALVAARRVLADMPDNATGVVLHGRQLLA